MIRQAEMKEKITMGGEQVKHKKGDLSFVFVHLFFYLYLFSLPVVFLPVSNVYARQGNGAKAESPYRESIALFEDGNVDKAIELVRGAIKANPEYPDAYNRLGYMLLKKGRINDALDAFRSAMKINQGSHASQTGMGLALLKKGDAKGAETIIKKALVFNPRPSMAHYALGLVYEKLKDYKKAIKQFKKGIKTYRSGENGTY